MLLFKNPQFYPNHYETLSKWGPDEDFIFTKFRYDWVKIVDFLIKAYFWSSLNSPLPVCSTMQLHSTMRLRISVRHPVDVISLQKISNNNDTRLF